MNTVQITAVHMVSPGTSHEHIGAVRWVQVTSGQVGESARQAMVDWLRDNQNNRAIVSDGLRSVPVAVVETNPPYIRTYADGVWTNNLLALPRF